MTPKEYVLAKHPSARRIPAKGRPHISAIVTTQLYLGEGHTHGAAWEPYPSVAKMWAERAAELRAACEVGK